MEQLVHAISRLISSISENFRKQSELFVQYLGPLKRLPEIAGQIRTDLARGFSTVAKAQVLIALAEQRGRYDAREELVQVEMSEVETIRQQVVEEAETIRQNALQLVQEVDRALDANISEMDGALLDLGRDLFPTAVFDPHVGEVVPGWQLLSSIPANSSRGRNQIIDNDLERLSEAIELFETHCQELQERAQLLGVSIPSYVEEVLVPVCFVEHRSASGQLQTDVVLAPKTNVTGDLLETSLPWLQKELAPRMEKIRESLTSQAEKLSLLNGGGLSSEFDQSLLSRLISDG